MRVIRKTFKGKMYEFCTINEIAKGSGRSLSQIRKMIERGIMPESNLRLPPVNTVNGQIAGARIYTKELALNVIEVIKTFRQGIPVTNEQKDKINKAFMDEKVALEL